MLFTTKQGYIYCTDSLTGSKTEIPNRDHAAESAGLPLMADDILYVPDNTGRRSTMMAIRSAAGNGAH